jgi:glycosyltransferase involved in cell wall biosynthesis
MNKKILYLSYDGMTDPLGQSQVINYLIGLRGYGYDFDILSFEKPEKMDQHGKYIQQLLDNNGIRWYPQKFHKNPPIVSKIYDKSMLYRVAKALHAKNKYDLIHCRSYPSAEVAIRLKRKTGVKFLFDMRGFWPNEKADGGHWDQKKLFWRMVYNYYKKKEKDFIRNADHIISLTRTGKKEMQTWDFYTNVPITVIPCCADTNNFLITTPQKKQAARSHLMISDDTFVVSYLGSLGTWYMIDEMLKFFAKVRKARPGALFLIISNSNPEIIIEKLSRHDLNEKDVKIINVPYTDVAKNMYASDISISFIRPVYSKIASSPVKIGEILSMGIPMIANNLGDSGLFIQDHDLGTMLENMDDAEMDDAVARLDIISKKDPNHIRKEAIDEYSLVKGASLYHQAYQQIF